MTSVAAGEGTVTRSDSRAAGDAPGRPAPGGVPVRMDAHPAAHASSTTRTVRTGAQATIGRLGPSNRHTNARRVHLETPLASALGLPGAGASLECCRGSTLSQVHSCGPITAWCVHLKATCTTRHSAPTHRWQVATRPSKPTSGPHRRRSRPALQVHETMTRAARKLVTGTRSEEHTSELQS